MGSLRNTAALIGSPRLGRLLKHARGAGLETLLCYRRLAMLVAAAEHGANLEGSAVEFGTFRGGSAGVLAQVLKPTGKILHVLDSFEGLPPPTDRDNYHKTGDFNDTAFEVVRDGLLKISSAVRVHRGYFDVTLDAIREERFCVAHIDVDLYESVRECLEFTYPRMAPGGIILLDDYGARTCLGAKAATDEFLATRPERIHHLTGAQHGIWVGRPGDDLFDYLRRRSGWTGNLPVLGAKMFRR